MRPGSRRVEACQSYVKETRDVSPRPNERRQTQARITYRFEKTTFILTTPTTSYFVVRATSSFVGPFFAARPAAIFSSKGRLRLRGGGCGWCWDWEAFTGEDEVGSRSDE